MLNSSILDTLIGLMLMYASLALVVSGITEMIGSWLGTRPKSLEGAVKQLLSTDIYNCLIAHPRIALLTREPESSKSGMQLPSYLASGTFASTLFEVLQTHLVPAMKQLLGSNPLQGGSAVTEFSAFRQAMEQRLQQVGATLQGAKVDTREQRMWQLLCEAARRAETSGQSLAEKVDAFNAEIESFYNEVMDRATGWFKRKTHFIAVIVSIVICASLNADTIQVARTLSLSSETRTQLVMVALKGETIAKEGVIANIANMGTAFPIGWVSSEMPGSGRLPWVMKILGILVSGLAVSLGSAFWFNALKEALRLAGKVPPGTDAAVAPPASSAGGAMSLQLAAPLPSAGTGNRPAASTDGLPN